MTSVNARRPFANALKRAVHAGLVTGVLAGCSAQPPNEPRAALNVSGAIPDGLAAQAESRVGTAAGREALSVVVRLTNRTAAPTSFTVNLHCPVVVRLYRVGADGVVDSAPTYDGSRANCSRAGRVLDLTPGREEQVSSAVPLAELRRTAVIPAGSYRVDAVVLANSADGPGPFTVPAGRIELP